MKKMNKNGFIRQELILMDEINKLVSNCQHVVFSIIDMFFRGKIP